MSIGFEISEERAEKERTLYHMALLMTFENLSITGDDLETLSNSMYKEMNSARGCQKLMASWINENHPNGIESKEIDDYTANSVEETASQLIANSIAREFYLADRWIKIQDNKENRPYLMYRTAGDSRVNEECKALDRIILPVDHPFWGEYFPPNRVGCRCGIRTISERELKQKDWKISPESHIKQFMEK